MWSEDIFYRLLVETIPTGQNITAKAIWSDTRIWQIYADCCPLYNVYFHDMQINRCILKKKTPFLHQTSGWLLLNFVEYLFLEHFFVSLDKSVFFAHCKCLMSKFPQILILLCRKIFSVFYPIFHETFSNSCGFALI